MAEISSNIKERILQIPNLKGITKEIFFSSIKSSYGNFKGKSKMTAVGSDVLEEISTTYPDISLEWVITGKGDKLKTGVLHNIKNKNQLIVAPKGRFSKNRDATRLINFYDVDFAAGDIEFYDDNNTIKPAYTMDIPEFNGCTAFRTYSNSMEKLIHSGDILFGTNIENWDVHLEYGQIYGIVCKDGRKYLKYIRKDKTRSETHFLLKSENEEEYDEFLLPKDRIKNIWLIHGWINKRV